MKSEKLNKKLALKKKTIADLNSRQMNRIKAGEAGTDTCYTCRTDCYSCLFKTCTSNFPFLCDTMGEFCDP